jgi:transcriptional regulator with XRE-family HTH domain
LIAGILASGGGAVKAAALAGKEIAAADIVRASRGWKILRADLFGRRATGGVAAGDNSCMPESPSTISTIIVSVPVRFTRTNSVILEADLAGTRKNRAPAATTAAAEPPERQLCDRVRALRKAKGWTLEQLASLSGVSRSMLSQIERGAANPTLAVAFRIAQAFGASLAELVDAPTGRTSIEVVRADDAAALFRHDKFVRIRTLSPLHTEKDVEFYALTLRPGGKLTSAAHFEGTREFLTIEKGAARVRSGDNMTELHAGDSAHYAADVPHQIENIGRGDLVAFLVDIYRA